MEHREGAEGRRARSAPLRDYGVVEAFSRRERKDRKDLFVPFVFFVAKKRTIRRNRRGNRDRQVQADISVVAYAEGRCGGT